DRLELKGVFNMNLLRSSGLLGFAYALVLPSASAQFAFAPEPPEPPDPPFFAVGAATLSGGSFLGVGVAEITSARARELKLREEHGVEITRVEEDSPAAKAGL